MIALRYMNTYQSSILVEFIIFIQIHVGVTTQKYVLSHEQTEKIFILIAV